MGGPFAQRVKMAGAAVNGSTHRLVAMLAMACLDDDERRIVYPRWGAIDAGTTLSDEFRIMWEPAAAGSEERELVHRCFVDSDDPRNHGGVTRSLDHAEGSISFIQSFLDGELEGSYTEDEFLEDLGMFVGVLSHHVADLCTPVHVGHKMDYGRVEGRSMAAFHGKVERDLGRLASRCSIGMSPARLVDVSREYFWSIAKDTYDTAFVRLESVYRDGDDDALLGIVSDRMTSAVRHTRDLWHTIFSRTNMTARKWSLQPLL